MAKQNIFICDACGKEIPAANGSILVMQHTDDIPPYNEDWWDLCIECEHKISTFIHSLGEKNA